MVRLAWPGLGFVCAASVALVACGSSEESTGTGGSGATTTSASGGSSAHGGHGGTIFTQGGGGSGGNGGGPDVCVGVGCAADQHCEPVGGVGTCVNNTCADLNCGPTEVCEPTPGGGAICKDISCTSDANCAFDEYCDANGLCAADVCTGGAQSCVGQDFYECASNGGSNVVKYSCGSTSYYTSQCVDLGNGLAYCGCEDDWDCPAYTTCEAGRCTGTGEAPTCSLAPVPFAQALPVNEIQWGGTGTANRNAVGSPFPTSSQACATPVVVNLDDDNGDGLVNELDFPEIVFMTYCNSDVAQNGIIRAIHGGGPNKGNDFFATCGATVWHEGDDPNMACPCANATGNSTAALAVGDLDNDGLPEIVVPTENAGLIILNHTGVPVTQTANAQWTGYTDPAVAIANIDGQGFGEIVVGHDVFTLAHDVNNQLVFVDHFAGSLMSGKNTQGPVACVGNVAGDSRLEIIGGSTVYALPVPPPGVVKRADCAVGALDDFCQGRLTVVWDGQTVNGAAALPNGQRDGFCAVADVLGTDETIAPSPTNPPDGKAEVALIANGYLAIFNGETGTLRRFVNLNVGTLGGAPNIDDFDGDGFPEIGTAFGSRYVLIDLQDPAPTCPTWPNAFTDGVAGLQGNTARAPGGSCTVDGDCAVGAVCNKKLGSCVCLHNGWMRVTEDDSSAVTSSSVFDFNGDGAAEVVYNDECYFRVYDGLSGAVNYRQNSPSRTRIEGPAIADIDNDGNAEIVFPSNNEVSFCSVGVNFPNGINVWGDASDAWVAARRIWNEHAYHVTNVIEGGGLPLVEPENWKTYNGRSYNTYRSNPRNYDVAPDLTVGGVQVSSPDATCGQLSQNLDITVEVRNDGDLRVGPGITLTFYGIWLNPALTEALYADLVQTPLTFTLQTSLEPGTATLVTVSYSAANNSPGVLPDSVRVVVDESNQARECNEANNEVTTPIVAGAQEPDLRIALGVASGAACPVPTVETTIFNDGSAPASNVLVRYYSGDPSQGGTLITETVIAGPIAAGQNVMFTMDLQGFPLNLDILVYGVVDPLNTILECNDGNNKDAADNKVLCSLN